MDLKSLLSEIQSKIGEAISMCGEGEHEPESEGSDELGGGGAGQPASDEHGAKKAMLAKKLSKAFNG